MIRALFLCGVLSVGSAWGQTLSPSSPEECRAVHGAWQPDTATCAFVVPPTHFDIVANTYVAIDPRISAQLNRIEAMLRAICENTRHSNGLVLPDCPKETKP